MIFNDNSTFYPTPKVIADKMFYKIKDVHKIKYILEPSAGKGDLIKHFKNRYKYSRWVKDDKEIDQYLKFDAIEIDENLSNLLRGNNFNVVYDDFLSYEPNRFYDLILANFPFDNDCNHLLKAIKIQERIGGEIVCLINAETLKNPYSNNRQYLKNLLEQYEADIEYIQNAFIDSERPTGVEVALIYINIPMVDNTTLFEREFQRDNPEVTIDDFHAVTEQRTKLDQLIFECELIKRTGEQLFKEKLRIDKLLNGMDIPSYLSICNGDYSKQAITINEYIDKINLLYWEKFINETDFKNRLPSKLRDNFNYNMKQQENIAFNQENVRYFYEQLIKSIPQSYEETVAIVFDEVTSKYAYTDSVWNKSIHYYNGWKTNNAYKINKKVIIPCNMGSWFYSLPNVLIDLNIIFENISGLKDDLRKDNKIKEAIEHNDKNIETRFFILDSYKKGTVHITFKDQKYLDMFNILAAKGKQWLPVDFGQKPYQNMSKEEKQLVKEFGLTPENYNSIALNSSNDYLRLTVG